MATTIANDPWFCTDCLFLAVNGDAPEDAATAARCEEGLASLKGHAVPDYDSETGDGIMEFSWSRCDCCGSTLGGERHRFAVLGT